MENKKCSKPPASEGFWFGSFALCLAYQSCEKCTAPSKRTPSKLTSFWQLTAAHLANPGGFANRIQGQMAAIAGIKQVMFIYFLYKPL